MTANTVRLALIPHKVIKLQLIHSILIQIKCKLHLLLISSPIIVTSHLQTLKYSNEGIWVTILGYIPSEDLEHNHGESKPMPFYPITSHFYLFSYIYILLYNARILKMKKLNFMRASSLISTYLAHLHGPWYAVHGRHHDEWRKHGHQDRGGCKRCWREWSC